MRALSLETDGVSSPISHLVNSPSLAVLREVIAVRAELWVTGTGGSMWPTIADGDRVLMRVLTRSPARGDIVLLDVSGRPTAHRVLAISAGKVTTSGDACHVVDPTVAVEALAGLAVVRDRQGTLTSLALTSEFGMSALLRGMWWTARAQAARLWRRSFTMKGAA